MSAFDNIKEQATRMTGDENRTDQAIQQVGDAVDERTGGQHADRVDQAQQAADSKLGTE